METRREAIGRIQEIYAELPELPGSDASERKKLKYHRDRLETMTRISEVVSPFIPEERSLLTEAVSADFAKEYREFIERCLSL